MVQPRKLGNLEDLGAASLALLFRNKFPFTKPARDCEGGAAHVYLFSLMIPERGVYVCRKDVH